LYPGTINLNIESVATARMYDVAPVDAFQLAVKDVCPTFDAAVATGAGGGNTCDAAPATKRQYARASDATNLGIINPFISLISSPLASHRMLMTSFVAGLNGLG
jgi:hypothetical protein